MTSAVEPWQIPRAAFDGTPWDDVETGVPAVVYGFRGEGVYGGLTPRAVSKFRREFLLGLGVYLAPTRALAATFGDVHPVRATLHNPAVLSRMNEAALAALDLDAIVSAGHDAVLIRSGQAGFGRGQESLRQAVVFPPFASNVERGVAQPRPSTLAVGSKARVVAVHLPPFAPGSSSDLVPLIGRAGVVASLPFGAGGPVRLRIGGRTVSLNQDEVQVEGGAHRESVARAVSQGLPVPPEVLADYPDLRGTRTHGAGPRARPKARRRA